MGSGTIVGGAGEDCVVREKPRYNENKVYTRKAFKGPRKDAVKKVAPPAEGVVVVPSGDARGNCVDGQPEEVALPTAAPAEEVALTTQPQSPAQLLPPVSAVVDVVPGETMTECLLYADDVPDETFVERLPVVNDLSDDTIAKRLPVVNEVSNDTVMEREESTVLGTLICPSGNGDVVNGSWDSKVKVNISSRSKPEIQDLQMKLRSDLDLVRNLAKKIKEKDGPLVELGNPRHLFNDAADNGSRMVRSEVGSVGITPRVNPSFNPLSVSVFENTYGVMDGFEKDKRTPKANQFYRNSEFLLAKDKFPTVESNKKSKTNAKKKGGEMKSGFVMGNKHFRSCSSLLEKLMKHQYGWVFKSPVDVKGLGLHDYFSIIKHPMDLGTIKTRLSTNWYKSPREFAEDVRVTFHNAMTYNPEGQDVHFMAQTLLKIFEERWAIIESDYNREIRFGLDYEMGLPTPTSRKMPFLPSPLDLRRVLDQSESMTVPTPKSISVSVTPSGRTPAPKKPKANDPHKREMTYNEKQKLSTNLQSLPSEKMDNIVQIIKRRNSQLFQHDDEIEVDIDTVDTETLWELDRFVSNYKKSLSKNKRKAELAMQARAAAHRIIQEKEPAVTVVDAAPRAITSKKTVVPSLLPIQSEALAPNSSQSTSSNSSSSDSGSSSSDSDTDSSSSPGSDGRQSPS